MAAAVTWSRMPGRVARPRKSDGLCAIGATRRGSPLRTRPFTKDGNRTVPTSPRRCRRASKALAESGDRFYGAVFVGCGVAWLWGAMQDPLPAKLFRFLAAIMLLGGMGRVIAFAAEGRPHQMFIGLTVVEFVFPAPVFFLASNRERPRQ